jgi:peptidoglycan/LPS O-acetylase OafA/YrhL
MSDAKSNLVNLQICRGFAATFVVIGHSLTDYDFFAARSGVAPAWTGINWGCGVNIFFVISGFIMIYTTHNDFASPGAPLRFIMKRALRIIPSYWLVTTIQILGSLILPSLLNVPIGNLQHILASYFFIPDWRPDMSAVRPVLSLGWTLNYEMFFYVAFAFSMFLPFKRGMTLLIFGFFIGIISKYIFDVKQVQISFWLDMIISNFIFGVCIGLIYIRGYRLTLPVAIIIGLIGLFFAIAGNPSTALVGLDLNSIRYGLPAAMFVAAMALGPSVVDGAVTRLGVAIGDASFSLYLIHPFIVRPLREVWLKLKFTSLPAPIYCFVCVFFAVLAALIIFRAFELPVAQMLRSWVPTRRLAPRVEHSKREADTAQSL